MDPGMRRASGFYRGLKRLLFVLVVAYSVGAQDDCTPRARWNCPCAGGTKRQYKRSQSLVSTAHLTRGLTQTLLRKMVNGRFQRNMHHIRALRRCAEGRHPACLNTYLERNCDLRSLPLVQQVDPDKLNSQDLTISGLLVEARDLLGNLAIFVEQARHEESDRYHHARFTLLQDIIGIEENGIYHLLCGLQQAFDSRNLQWSLALEKDLIGGCQVDDHLASADNRNYMVFHTLEKALGSLTHTLRWVESHGTK